MSKRIWRISEDRFDDPVPAVELSDNSIDVTGTAGEELSGHFLLHSAGGVRIRGLVYSSSPYVTVLDPEFDGTDVTIRWKTGKLWFTEEDVIDGVFTVIYNRGTKEIPYHLTFQKPEDFPYQSLGEFVNAQQSAPEKALSFFHTDRFASFLGKYAPDQMLLYAGFRNASPTMQNLENFLAAAGLKEPVTFSVDRDTVRMEGLTGTEETELLLTRNTRGFLSIHVSARGDFLSPDTEEISDADFLGREYAFRFRILRDRMHLGTNRGEIVFSSQNTEKHISVICSYSDGGERSEKEHAALIYRTAREYFSFRRGQVSLPDWSGHLDAALDTLSAAEEKKLEAENGFLQAQVRPVYRLLRCYALIQRDAFEEALSLIRDLKEDITDHYSADWAFLLYLLRCMEEDETYRAKLSDEIERIFRLNPEDVRIFLILLQIRHEYEEDPARKLKDIRQWIMNGSGSAFLREEVYELYQAHPFLISTFDDFTVMMLLGMTRQHLLTEDVVLEILQIMKTTNPPYDPRLMRILSGCYAVWKKEELLDVILEFLIRGRRTNGRALSWYLAGIRQSRNITGIFEAYMDSIGDGFTGTIPEQVLYYFQYPSQIAEDRKALLYAYILSNRNRMPGLFRLYAPAIEDFAFREAAAGRIDENLSVIYQNVFDRGIFTDDAAGAFEKFAFFHRAAVIRDDIKRLVLYQDSAAEPLFFPVHDHIAYFPVIDADHVLLFEDSSGNRMAGKDLAADERMFRTENSLERLRSLSSDRLPFLLHDFSVRSEKKFRPEDRELIRDLLSDKRIRTGYVRKYFSRMYDAGAGQETEDLLSEYLLMHTSFCRDFRSLRTRMLSYAALHAAPSVMEGLLQEFPAFGMSDGTVFGVLERSIEPEEQERDADFLIAALAALLDRGVSSEKTVRFLTARYSGPRRMEEKLFGLAEGYRLDVSALAERILVQLLYTDDATRYPAAVFESYMARRPDRLVTEAFLTYWSRQYILDRFDPELSLLGGLMRAYAAGDCTNDSERIALLKGLCLSREMTDEKRRVLDGLLRYYISRNIWFPFYMKADYGLVVKYHLYDRTFVSYRGRPGRRLMISWENEGRTVSLPMNEMYEGIYVRMFCLFFGEKIDYVITDAEEMETVLARDSVSGQERVREGEENRYDSINRIQADLLYRDDDSLKEHLRGYTEKLSMTESLLRPL